MMQKCSELGSNPEAWQQLFRFGKNRLKVKKGPNGHYLEPECRDELQKTLPAKDFDSLMSSVATWMARLDEKDKKVRRLRKTVKVPKKLQSEPPVEQQTSEDGDNVVDLCSDVEEKDGIGESEDSLDTETVLSHSSVIVIDDDLGEVNLRDFADHIEGKTVKKNNQKEQNTTQDLIKKFLGPRESDALRRSLKTYANKRKPKVNGETTSEAMNTNKDPKILREVNREASREAGQVTKADLAPTRITLITSGDSQQRVQIVTEPTAYYDLIKKTNESELGSKSEPEVRGNAKENEPKKGYNSKQAAGGQTKEGALPEDSSRNQRVGQDNRVPQIRIRTDLGADQRDVIRVRTDLLLEQSPQESQYSLSNQTPSAETLVPERSAKKRTLPEAQSSQHPPKRPTLQSQYPQYGPDAAPSTSSSCQLSISISPGYPSSTSNYQGNPAPVPVPLPPVNPTPARAPLVNPAPAPPVVTVKYRLIAPASVTSTSATSSYPRNVSNSCQANLPSLPTSVSSASASSSGYPSSGSHMCPVTSTSSHQPNNPANPAPVANPMTSPVIPMITNYPPSYQYQPSVPLPAAPVGTSMYPPGAPAAPLPPLSYPQAQPLVAPAPATAMASNGTINLDNIMNMLSQVELFAFKQANQEAYALAGKLRDSLLRGVPFGQRR
ncbi:uncharacterized protein [Drosophila kikkawai]|uniref:Actin cytoskeleton-regulatory complex protein pan1-like n=1 Tax=Drosophila kikkawai TaxID=30033 RepID=A0A6P4I6X1_DROKI|nr:actin cytoskeleton-regulatory complex protein pan1 [Drosophila kikkawai]XP_017019604.1 actin cytoskeleton-regulatory complex protein pan1 [Drosophila kikkawai]